MSMIEKLIEERKLPELLKFSDGHIKIHAAEQHALHKGDAEISDRKCRHDYPSFFHNIPILS